MNSNEIEKQSDKVEAVMDDLDLLHLLLMGWDLFFKRYLHENYAYLSKDGQIKYIDKKLAQQINVLHPVTSKYSQVLHVNIIIKLNLAQLKKIDLLRQNC